MGERPRRGDKVQWNTPQGPTTGTVAKTLVAPCDIAGHHVAASREEPQYLVVSDRSGKQAAHKREALTRKDAS